MTPIRRVLVLSASALLTAVGAAAQSPAQLSILSDADIHKILVERVDTQKQSVGIVVGIIEPTDAES